MNYMVIERKDLWESEKLTLLFESDTVDEAIAFVQAIDEPEYRVIFIVQLRGLAASDYLAMLDDNMREVARHPFANGAD